MIPTALSVSVVAPELILSIGALGLLLLGALRGDKSGWLVCEIAVAILGVALIVVMFDKRTEGVTFYGAFTNDSFARFMKALALIGSLVSLLLSLDFLKEHKFGGFEFPILMLLSTIGMMMLISASDFIALYLGLELMSLALYVIAAYRRDDLKASEAGLKYFVLGALSSGMLLYGISLIYGFSGSVNFKTVAEALHGHAGIGVVFGLVFVIAGLAFKISAVPFHMWTPDVYEGAPTPVTAFFASAPKMAAMAVVVRVLMVALPGVTSEWRQIVAFISIASMALGAFAAIGQTNIKRLMAYSSIGHMGFALVGVASGTVEGAQGVAIYMAIYVVMTLGTFGGILSMRRGGQYVEQIDDLAGLLAHQSHDGVLLCGDDVLACRHPAVVRLLRQVLCVRSRHQRRALSARGHRRADQCGRRLLLLAHRQGHVFRRTGAGLRQRHDGAASGAGRRGAAHHSRHARARRADRRRRRRRQEPVLSVGRFTLNGWRVERHDALDSTSEEARRRALAGDPGRVWIVAEEQTAGRGRHGRHWRSPRGNFYGSALLLDPCAVVDGAQLGFVAGLATQEAVADFGVEARLKWPNDLLVNGAKLSGVLLEGWNVGKSFAVGVGVGVNLAAHPDDLPYPATHLAALVGRTVTVRDFVERLAVRFDEALTLFARGAGFADVRERWLERAAGLGGLLRATTGKGVREGLFAGLDPRGRLLLRVQDAIETLESADIALLTEAPGGESSS